ncbi:hypothetical protein HanRHA438_Chr09g0385421 [Helianthus annuus]|uniref:Uncharacterized protein n=1 Tax=Helianthus annuus TaxID=4232 RepID=A0A9K3N781_HELAN|nr:hypothetical protein HanXRQr2_Chr09g0373421 [Helianthus annuus]KAJ0524986.1 hypothetical protein HanHA300_Chr09g0306781 [Helianthus annuus]KAJ0541348.1 hypothetical protein HanHA89_Chr09g0327381 [Helianthus annuus]KAJ0706427.1 hypothetical protein HanLR1_Chr09g0306851 [Helianthus annuus]KAJ0886969.1 hypothetical protein HanRHA438_Chr09g0385421 [Helianthus annuus]
MVVTSESQVQLDNNRCVVWWIEQMHDNGDRGVLEFHDNRTSVIGSVESFWWYIATINSKVKTSKVDLSVKVMLPLYQALMLQGRTVRKQPSRRCLTIYFPSQSFFIRDGFAQNGFQSTGQLKKGYICLGRNGSIIECYFGPAKNEWFQLIKMSHFQSDPYFT